MRMKKPAKGQQGKVKDKAVCEGCRYRVGNGTANYLEGTCNYTAETGESRLMKELKAGGYKTDSCVCYEKKSGRRKRCMTIL